MFWVIFWAVVGAYLAVGVGRIPTYYRRWYEASRDEWSFRSEQEHQRSGAWTAILLALVWPYYEGGRWVRDTLIHAVTAEERREQEYLRAERIVQEYNQTKEREARESFDRKLRGEQ